MKVSANMIVTPKVMMNSDEVRHYPAAQRNCYFGFERRLKYFRQYTQSNCENECRVDSIWEICGCLPIYIESSNKCRTNTCV